MKKKQHTRCSLRQTEKELKRFLKENRLGEQGLLQLIVLAKILSFLNLLLTSRNEPAHNSSPHHDSRARPLKTNPQLSAKFR